jgi:putative addiction module component (TIGR02574 family)
MSDTNQLPSVAHLSVPERLRLIETLWDSIEPEAEGSVSVPHWHLAVLAERIASDDADASQGESWAEVRQAIEQRR